MIIYDLSHLEVVSEAPSIAGGLFNYEVVFYNSKFRDKNIFFSAARVPVWEAVADTSSWTEVTKVVDLPGDRTRAVAAVSSDGFTSAFAYAAVRTPA